MAWSWVWIPRRHRFHDTTWSGRNKSTWQWAYSVFPSGKQVTRRRREEEKMKKRFLLQEEMHGQGQTSIGMAGGTLHQGLATIAKRMATAGSVLPNQSTEMKRHKSRGAKCTLMSRGMFGSLGDPTHRPPPTAHYPTIHQSRARKPGEPVTCLGLAANQCPGPR